MAVNDVTDRQIAIARSAAIFAVLGWLVAAGIGGVSGILNHPDRGLPALFGFVAVPAIGFVAAYVLSASFRAFAHGLSLTWIVGSHLWRFVGLGFVIAWAAGRLPAGFAIPEGLGDIAAALGALALLPSLTGGTASRRWLLAWNAFGFLDLVSALVMGVLYSNSPLGLLSDGVTTELMVTFPVSLIPTFFVPLFLLLHLLTFRMIAEMNGVVHHGYRGWPPPSPAR